MQKKKLGTRRPELSAMGLGCMGMSAFYGQRDDVESIATIHAALDRGMNFIDTSDMYGNGANEELIGRAIKGRRQEVVLATKFGYVMDENNAIVGVNGRPEYVKQSCERNLTRLGVEVIDLYYLHRVDPNTPIEETVGAMADLVKEGKVRYLGLSEAAPETLERAVKVHPIAALQSEYSIWTRDVEDEILPLCTRLGITFVAYSPLGRGFLTGSFKSESDLGETDTRKVHPRFQGENFQQNLEIVHGIERLAAKKGCTPAQLALAWLLAQAENIVPLFGTKKRKYLEENLGALNVQLDTADIETINEIAPHGITAGTRYPEAGMKMVGR